MHRKGQEAAVEAEEVHVSSCEIGDQAGELCPACLSATLREEGAHGRCDTCGYIGKCCE